MNIAGMMKQVQEMQAKMADMQKHLAESEVNGQAGGGMVAVVMNGKSEMKKIKIDPNPAVPAKNEMLKALIFAASNDARAKAEAYIAAETEKMMGGMQLPPGVK